MLLLVGAAFARPCATLQALPAARPVRVGQVAAAAGARSVRDLYGTPYLVESEHFAGRWGETGGVGIAEVEQLLSEFEVAWAVEIDQMGHPAPYGTDAFKFNVYVGDTGDGAPTSYGAGGYYTVDADGWPMIVVAEATMSDAPTRAHTAAHEFYHALQGVDSRYAYEGASAWYWEATAEWAALQVDPDNTANGPFLFGYVLLPALPVNAFDYPDSFALEEYHQYGAFLFPYDLTERVGEELVVETWLDPGDDPDPLEVMRARLADRGEDLDVLWLDHAARATAYDYPLGNTWSAQTDYVDAFYPDAKFTAHSVSGEGGEGRVRGGEAPRRYGTARIEHVRPDAGTLRVVVDGEAEGSEGSPAEYGARVVQVAEDRSVRYVEVPFDGTHGEVEVELGDDDDHVFLVVSAWTDRLQPSRWESESFPFEWSLQVTPIDTSIQQRRSWGGADPAPAACGCGSTSVPPLAALVVLPWLRRRRWTSSA